MELRGEIHPNMKLLKKPRRVCAVSQKYEHKIAKKGGKCPRQGNSYEQRQ